MKNIDNVEAYDKTIRLPISTKQTYKHNAYEMSNIRRPIISLPIEISAVSNTWLSCFPPLIAPWLLVRQGPGPTSPCPTNPDIFKSVDAVTYKDVLCLWQGRCTMTTLVITISFCIYPRLFGWNIYEASFDISVQRTIIWPGNGWGAWSWSHRCCVWKFCCCFFAPILRATILTYRRNLWFVICL